MNEVTKGIVLRVRPLTESSLIVRWLTPDLGRVSTVAKGARRPKSAFRGKLDLFYSADFSFQRSRRSDLHSLCEVKLLETHEPLRHDLLKLQQGCYCAELIEQATETDTPLPEIYALMEEFVRCVCKFPASPATVLGFELRLLEELGLQPDFEKLRLPPGTIDVLSRLRDTPIEDLAQRPVPDSELVQPGRYLLNFILHHLGKVPKERTAALAH